MKKTIKSTLLHMAVLITITMSTYAQNNYETKRNPPVDPAFIQLPVGDIKPEGWLLDWANTAIEGIGGFENMSTHQKWEVKRLPERAFINAVRGYAADGLIKLAVILDNKELYDVVVANLDEATFDGITEGACVANFSAYYYFKAMMTWYEHTGDEKILRKLENALFNKTEMYFTDKQWHQNARPLLLSQIMFEIYQHGGDERLLGKALEALSVDNHDKAGWSKRFYELWTSDNYNPMWHKAFNHTRGGEENSMHAVTYHEMIKLWAIHYQWNNDPNFLKVSENAIKYMLEHEGIQTYGTTTGQENLLGIGATAATETCNFIDMCTSLNDVFNVSGKAQYADISENSFYNGSASSVSRDFKTHVYLQAPNMLDLTKRFTYIPVHSPTCCHGNIPRMLPIFIAGMWKATLDGGAAIVHYAPNTASIKVGNQVDAKFKVGGNYPFKNNVQMTLNIDKPTDFPMYFRIPAWSAKNSISVNGKMQKFEVSKDGFAKIDRTWKNNDVIAITFDMKPVIHEGVTFSNGGNPSIRGKSDDPNKKHFEYKPHKVDAPYRYVTRGPLTYALPLEASNEYSYALRSDAKISIEETTMPKRWDWPLDAPVKLHVKVANYDWKEFPEMPDTSVNVKGNDTEIELIPIGCTQAKRVSMFPMIQ